MFTRKHIAPLATLHILIDHHTFWSIGEAAPQQKHYWVQLIHTWPLTTDSHRIPI